MKNIITGILWLPIVLLITFALGIALAFEVCFDKEKSVMSWLKDWQKHLKS
jgi:hypothetical protein